MTLSARPRISISHLEVLKFLGHPQSPKFIQMVKEVNQQATNLLSSIYHITEYNNILDHLEQIDNSKMQHCNDFVGVASIGSRLEQEVSHLLDSGLISQGMVLDAHGTVAVRKVVEETLQAIKIIARKASHFLGDVIVPGVNGDNLQSQRVILQALGNQNDIVLTEKLLLKPLKSSTFYVPLFHNQKKLQNSIPCKSCSHYSKQCKRCEIVL